jgi:hypothetical protein
VVESAVSDRDGSAAFTASEDRHTGHLSDRGSMGVRTVRLDTLIESGGISPPDVIKMDIEQGEVAALKGAMGVLKRYRPILFIATHGSEIRRECLHLLAGIGYTLESLDASPIEQADEFVAKPPLGTSPAR